MVETKVASLSSLQWSGFETSTIINIEIRVFATLRTKLGG